MDAEQDGRLHDDDKSRHTLLVQLASLSDRWLTLATEDVAKANSTLPTQINPNTNLQTDKGSNEITVAGSRAIPCLSGRLEAFLPSAGENSVSRVSGSEMTDSYLFWRPRNPELLRHLIPYFWTNQQPRWICPCFSPPPPWRLREENILQEVSAACLWSQLILTLLSVCLLFVFVSVIVNLTKICDCLCKLIDRRGQ